MLRRCVFRSYGDAAAQRAGLRTFEPGTSATMVDLVARRSPALWRGIMSSPMLTLGGWFAFNLPRTVTATGQSLLAGLVAVHVYVWTVQPGLPGYFAVFAAVLTGGCLIGPRVFRCHAHLSSDLPDRTAASRPPIALFVDVVPAGSAPTPLPLQSLKSGKAQMAIVSSLPEAFITKFLSVERLVSGSRCLSIADRGLTFA
jgi:hypothetical protein